jgi:hypothetical protein
MMPPEEKPTLVEAKPQGKQRAKGKTTKASDERTNCNWLKEASRRAWYTPLNENAISLKDRLFCFKAQS